jgi:transposase InsO family protein
MNAAVLPWAIAFSPQGNWLQVPAGQTQTQLREWFGRWGLPGQLRVDNGGPWGSSDDLPTPLALWLVGLGIAMHWNDPRSPQQNGVVERSMGTMKRWSEPRSCSSVAQWQERLDREERLYRHEYPLPCGQTRWQHWPGLRFSGRRYSLRWEQREWSFAKAVEHLANYTLERKVSSNGYLSLFNRSYRVGPVLSGKVVKIWLDPQSVQWLVMDRQSAALLRALPAETVNRKNIVTLLKL